MVKRKLTTEVKKSKRGKPIENPQKVVKPKSVVSERVTSFNRVTVESMVADHQAMHGVSEMESKYNARWHDIAQAIAKDLHYINL